jgi:hypothetical protein
VSETNDWLAGNWTVRWFCGVGFFANVAFVTGRRTFPKFDHFGRVGSEAENGCEHETTGEEQSSYQGFLHEKSKPNQLG